jgi:transitional endoplasmic reticulum ATPase
VNGRRQILELAPLLSATEFNNLFLASDEEVTLGDFLHKAPALSRIPIDEDMLLRPLSHFSIQPKIFPPGIALYRPAGLTVSAANADPPGAPMEPRNDPGQAEAPPNHIESGSEATSFPDRIEDRQAVLLAYEKEIGAAASFLKAGLSVLIICEKLLVESLWRDIARRGRLEPKYLDVPEDSDVGFGSRSLRQRQLAKLKEDVVSLKAGQVLVVPHLDLIGGGSDTNLSGETRELIELLYASTRTDSTIIKSARLLLAFADPSLDLPEVLAARFAVRIEMKGVPQTIEAGGKTVPLGAAMVTRHEAEHFEEFEPTDLYKHVAGMNPVRLRDAIRYAVEERASHGKVKSSDLYEAIRAFKVQNSAKFEVPKVRFDQIGGYDELKRELQQTIDLIVGGIDLPNEELRQELIPRGLLFYGPPGTGKTLFAKAIAYHMQATIQIVSGPEVTDMYVGESERKVRELFSEARRNAPAVLVFDEFDSIASKRSGREDGGSRAGNALVAQILTEMDGFRPGVPMLVIGTTNRLDIVDEALLRPSRFKPISIGLPDPAARRAIAEVHAKHFEVKVSSLLLKAIADATEGMNGDDIRSLFRDACLGLICEGISPDAYRLGQLLGKLRRSYQSRSAAQSPGDRRFQASRRGGGERPAPSTSHTPLIQSPASGVDANG